MITEHTIGGRILYLRDSQGVQQQELAAALGISSSALRNLEHGDTLPRLSTLELLSDFFKVSIDYLVRGIAPTQDSGDGVDTQTLYRATGLNDDALMYLREQIDIGDNCGGKNGYIAALNAVMTGGFPRVVWGLKVLNDELAAVNADIKKVLDKTPKLKERGDIKKFTMNDIVDNSDKLRTLDKLEERRDLLIMRYLRSVENVFNNLIDKGESE